MKSVLFCLSLCAFFNLTGQTGTTRFYQKSNRILEVRPGKIYVYDYQYGSSNYFSETTYQLTDSLQPDGSGNYTNDETSINLDHKKAVLTNTESGKRLKLKEITSDNGYYELVQRYLRLHSNKLDEELNDTFSLDSYDEYWYDSEQAFEYVITTESCDDQRKAIDQLVLMKTDSLKAVHADYFKRSNEFVASLETQTLGTTTIFLNSIPEFGSYDSKYREFVIQKMVDKNPSLFYDLMENTAENRNEYYHVLDGLHYKILKEIRKDSPIHKELREKHRKDILVGTAIVSGVVIIDTAVIGGIVYLIVRLTR
jgi:hypothetical protein